MFFFVLPFFFVAQQIMLSLQFSEKLCEVIIFDRVALNLVVHEYCVCSDCNAYIEGVFQMWSFLNDSFA